MRLLCLLALVIIEYVKFFKGGGSDQTRDDLYRWSVLWQSWARRLGREISGFEASTTNNRMEMMAAIQALRLLREPCEVELYSDSSYLVDAFNKKWIQNWMARGWVKTDKKPVKNQDLWEELVALSSTHKVRFVYVKGHADNPENNRCDQLATGAIRLARGEQNSGAKEGA